MVVGLYFFIVSRYRIACVFDPASNTVLYTGVAGEFYRNHEKLINFLDSFVYGVGIPGVMVIVVTTTTIITAMKIRQAAAWRAGTSSASGSSSSSISPREVALTKMLIGSSVLFIVSVSPNALFRCVWPFLPEMNLARRNHNFYLTGLWVLETCTYVNATFNIFVYYTMGSRYRETLWSMFGRKNRGKVVGKNSMTQATHVSQ